ncbi:Peroxisomal multifunctional enzyme type 2 [Nymphon striatum]|nr:Peroxisomal multifunctional enzyme type 2 [Nymphon striatum]
MSASKLQFCGKVAIVTGAGGGLGRQYAIQLAERGAALVVNDLGGARDGEGKSCKAADIVVGEIKSTGGKAIADYNSVEDGDKIVQTAIDKYGKVDIVINNAGIIRDKSFMKMSVKDWDLVQNVHLRGSFLVTKAAWPYLRQQNFGKVIFTSSASAIYGNFGQSNYSAAKLGLIGLCKTLAIEGAKYNIHCNTVIPTAASRLTEDLLPSEVQDLLKPEFVAPLVTWLTHHNCNESGKIFEAGGGWIGKYEYYRSKGVNVFDEKEGITPEEISNKWEEITDMTNCETLTNMHAQVSSIIQSASVKLDHKLSFLHKYSPQDIILYALSVGSSLTNLEDFKFLYENAEHFLALPTYGTIPAVNLVINNIEKVSALLSRKLPGVSIDFSKLLHGEHYMEVLRPLNVNGGTLTSTLEVADILDKGSGIVLVFNIHTFDEDNNAVYFNQMNAFLTEGGGFGGQRSSSKVIPIIKAPNRDPDSVLSHKTSYDQSALYRLNGDVNPLHIDPEFSALGGFSEPILHGLCSLGIATRHVMSMYASDDSLKFKCVKARFTNPLLPGQTIRTQMWKEESRIHFEVDAKETGKTIISHAYIDLVEHEQNGINLKSTEIFRKIEQEVLKSPNVASDVMAIFQWNITDNNQIIETWILDLNEKPSVYIDYSKSLKPDCILTCNDKTATSMMIGKLNPKNAFASGVLKIEGDMSLDELVSSSSVPSHKKTVAIDYGVECQVQNLTETITEIGNPYRDDFKVLVALDTHNCADASVITTVNTIEEVGTLQ